MSRAGLGWQGGGVTNLALPERKAGRSERVAGGRDAVRTGSAAKYRCDGLDVPFLPFDPRGASN